MPILAKNNESVIALTYKCNWHCSYCSVKNKYDYKDVVTIDDNIKKINSIKNNQIVTLTGGEIGLLDKSELLLYFSLLKTKLPSEVYLETNGLFLLRHNDLLHNFSTVLYHCSLDMNINDEIIVLKNVNIRYLLIVNDTNIGNLKNFIHKYKDIKFDIIAATYPYASNLPILSKCNRYKILHQYSSNMTKESIQRMLKEKDFDKITWYM